MGLTFPVKELIEQPKEKVTVIPKEIQDLIEKCRETEKTIKGKLYSTVDVDNLIELYKEATGLNWCVMKFLKFLSMTNMQPVDDNTNKTL